MLNSQEVIAVALWLMVGGGILAVFGIAAAMLGRSSVDRGGLSKPLALVGVALFIVGLYLDQGWIGPW
ncbi:MAG: hypothetical protein V3U99_04530 [Alphaproteobacteria bacterium]|jgi:hypothetical protein